MKEGRIKNIEKALFKFIFAPSTLKKGKRKFISSNISIFSRELELLVNFKDQLNKKVSARLVEKIKERIHKLNNKKKITLKKVIPPFSNTNILKLSADSPDLNDNIISETYRDDDDNFLVKVKSDKNENRIFTFRKESAQQKDSKLILHPSDASFILNSSSNFFILKPRHEITGMTIIP